MERCAPPVANVQSLVDTLNASNDFSAFVRHMRKSFRSMVSRRAAAATLTATPVSLRDALSRPLPRQV